MTMTRGTRWAAGVAVAVLVAVTGCDAATGANVETKTEADVNQVVQQYADQVAALIGGVTFNESSKNAAACTGRMGESSDGVFSVQGAYQLPMDAARQLDTIARVRDAWKAQGYEITDDRTIADGRGVLTARTGDGYSLDLSSTRPPTAMALLIHSACYESPTPRR
jgi:hypothetical protein